MYKLICIDMDGTLLNSAHKISKISKNTLKKAHDMGIHIVISTGRTYADAESYSNFIGVKSPIIACNGSLIKEKDRDEVIYKSIIDENLCTQLLNIFKKYNVKPTYSTQDKVYCSSLKTIIFVEFAKIRGFMNKCIKLNFIWSWNKWLNIFSTEKDNIIKCEIHDKDQEKVNNVRKELEALSGIEITSSHKNNIEINRIGTSKGKAIEVLASYYNIKREEIIAIGDNENDLSAIEFAGIGIAMGNASERVKKKSNYITDTNDNNGVAKAIDKFILLNSEEL